MGFFIIIPIQKNLLPHLHNYFSIFTLIFFAFFFRSVFSKPLLPLYLPKINHSYIANCRNLVYKYTNQVQSNHLGRKKKQKQQNKLPRNSYWKLVCELLKKILNTLFVSPGITGFILVHLSL